MNTIGIHLPLLLPLVYDFRNKGNFVIPSDVTTTADMPLRYTLNDNNGKEIIRFENGKLLDRSAKFLALFAVQTPFPTDYNAFFIRSGNDLRHILEIRFRIKETYLLYFRCDYDQVESEIYEDNGLLVINSITRLSIP